MRILFKIITPVLLVLATTGCSLRDLADAVEPASWEKQKFEREVSKAVRRAVNTPGIDNGSTIVVTMSGDTLIAPTDSIPATSQLRTVYVDIQSPTYPSGISGRTLEIAGVIAIISVVAGIIVLILLGVFIVIFRRQHGRNKAINHAIDQNYDLPESFFTGVPASPAITINQLKEIHHNAANNDGQDDVQQDSPDSTPETETPTVDVTYIREAIKTSAVLLIPSHSKA